MHIAIYHNLPSGGAKRALYELARHLANHHTLDVYTLSSANHDFADLRPHATRHKVYAFAPTTALSSPWGRLNQVLRLGDLLRLRRLTRNIARDMQQTRYDLVFVHGCQYEKAPSILQHLAGVPTVYYCQESLRHLYEPMPARAYEQGTTLRTLVNRIDPLPALYHANLKYWDRRNLHRASRVLVNSEYSRSEIERIYGVDARVSYLGVEVDCFRPLDMAKADFVLSVGSLTPLKGFDFLITALGQIAQEQRPPLVIASNFQNPPERAYLEALAAAHAVKLRLMGNISDEQLVELYNQALLTVYAPIREPFGLVALESMACGTPVVGVGEGGILETVRHAETGLLSERDAGQFGAAVQQLLADPALMARMGECGRQQVVGKWGWLQAGMRLEKHLTEL